MNVIEITMFATWTNLLRTDTMQSYMVSDMELLSLFQNMEEKHVALLRPLFERVSYRVGETVIEQGKIALFLYLIVRGQVEISYKPYDGEAITVSHVAGGGLFGWSALVGSAVYTSSGVAIEDIDAMRIRGSDLRKLCAEHPEAGRVILDRLASVVSSRWKDAHEQVRTILEDGMNSK